MTGFNSGSITSPFAHPRMQAGYRGGRPRPSQGLPRHRCSRRTRRRRLSGYCCKHPSQFAIEEFAGFKHLLAAWNELKRKGGDGAGEDGLTFTDFSDIERNEAIRVVGKSIMNRTYTPQPLRTALVPKDIVLGTKRELLLQAILDRVVAKAMLMSLDGSIRETLPNYGRDVWCTYAQIANYVRRHGRYWLAIDDVKNCYPTVPTTPALEAFCRDFYHEDDLVWLIIQIIRGHDGCDKVDGVDQGSPLAPPVVEAFLYRYLDTVLGAQFQGNPLRFRYYDNLPILANSESEGQRLMQVTGETLEPHRMSLKGEDVSGDLRDRQYNGVLLGFTPHWMDGQIKFTIPESAYEDLIAGFRKAIEAGSLLTAEYVAHGWIQAHGPALTNTVLPTVVERVTVSARQHGFRLSFRRQLTDTGRQARQRWLRLLEEESNHAC